MAELTRHVATDVLQAACTPESPNEPALSRAVANARAVLRSQIPRWGIAGTVRAI
jgi:hypothetical protein